MKAALLLATQLFAQHPAFDDPDIEAFLVVESAPRFRRRPYHSSKMVLLLAGLRQAVERLRAAGRTVHVVSLREDVGFADGLRRLVVAHDIDGLAWMSATDRGVDAGIARVCRELGVRTRRYPDALFLTSAEMVDAWFAEHGSVPMEDFYRWQRRRTGILMEGERPAGGRWNYDADNREPLPKRGILVPSPPREIADDITRAAIADVGALFPSHPGDPADFWLPVTPERAAVWLDDFVEHRLGDFGRYEDAMARDEPFLFHSVLSALLNTGLLTVTQVLDAVLRAEGVPIASVEGFVRQVIGWREYMRGAYRNLPELRGANTLHLTRALEPYWYTGVDVPEALPLPVRVVLERVHRYGYAHHIERLMVLGNWFLLEGYDPHEVYEWFLALFVDAYDWVMLPNVVGMSQYADGGAVATKPYVSGGAYLQRMGSWWPTAADAKASVFTERYWEFLERHEPALAGNPRMRVPLAQMRTRREKRQADAADRTGP